MALELTDCTFRGPALPEPFVKFELEKGYEYWLGMHNFYVITRYNHSAMYAMSVHQLSQRIAARMEGR